MSASDIPDSNTGEDRELFFHFIDMVNGFSGIYWLKGFTVPMTNTQPPVTFKGPSRSFNTKGPQAVDRLDCKAVYLSREVNGNISSDFVLNFSSGAVQVSMPHHLIGPNGMVSASKDGQGSGSTFLSGDLVFVRNG